GAIRAGQLIAHTSGRYGTGVLEPALRGSRPCRRGP
ncbi:oxidoreductase, partial [Streptomyces daliensis]|nr:oxidoreductase [Streptomyces daliensis]